MHYSREVSYSTLLLAGCLVFVLQGRGVSARSIKATTLITATTSTPGPRTPPLSPEQAVKLFNKQYMNYSFETLSGLLGVTISWAAQMDDFNKNLFCHPVMGTGCYNGESDCRMSASLFNWKMVNKDYIWATTFGRPMGYVFNQTMVEKDFGKCSYIFDGATENRYNNGCGIGAGANCSNNKSAYANICSSTGKTCTASDPEVKNSLCVPFGPVPNPQTPAGRQCLYSGPALNYPKPESPNHLSEMVKARFQNEIKTQDYMAHNEVVLDERLLIPAIRKDPAVVIPAFVYAKSKTVGRQAAEQMRDKFCEEYQVSKIPVIGINDEVDFRPTGPFFIPEDSLDDPARNTVIV